MVKVVPSLGEKKAYLVGDLHIRGRLNWVGWRRETELSDWWRRKADSKPRFYIVT